MKASGELKTVIRGTFMINCRPADRRRHRMTFLQREPAKICVLSTLNARISSNVEYYSLSGGYLMIAQEAAIAKSARGNLDGRKRVHELQGRKGSTQSTPT